MLNATGANASSSSDNEPESPLVFTGLAWDNIGGGILILELLSGLAWFVYLQKTPKADQPRNLGFGFLHGLMQFLPLLVSFRIGWVDCATGLWWPVHWTYMLCLVLAAPGLGAAKLEVPPRIPVLGCRGTSIASVYKYLSTLATASDQYLDCMNAAVALQCGWELAWVMVAIVFLSLLVQACAAACATTTNKRSTVMLSLIGANPEAASSLSSEGADDDYESGAFSNVATPVDPFDEEAWIASQGVAKMFSENLPQAYLAWRFAQDMKPSSMVYFSICMSLGLAAKACLSGLTYFSKRCSRTEPGMAPEE